jgi:hypothetical protein
MDALFVRTSSTHDFWRCDACGHENAAATIATWAAALTSLSLTRLEGPRELWQGSITVLEKTREELRSAARERLLASASQVEGMTLILTLCCLPALALLVVIPLFVTLLAGLFG